MYLHTTICSIIVTRSQQTGHAYEHIYQAGYRRTDVRVPPVWESRSAPVAGPVLREAAEGALVEPPLSVHRLPAASLGTRVARGGQGRVGRRRRGGMGAASPE